MKYWGKDIRDALHGDGPLAFPVLKRRGMAGLVTAGGSIGYALARVALVLLGIARTIGRGILAVLKFIWWIFWPVVAGAIAIVAYNWLLLACFFDTLPKTGFHHEGLGWTMLAAEILAILFAIGKATK